MFSKLTNWTAVRKPVSGLVMACLLAGPASVPVFAGDVPTKTPIKHVVVIFQENVSFDHYFATYPKATNPQGEPFFKGKYNTPGVNGLTGALLHANPNSSNPFRLDRSQAATCDMDHDYTAEQLAFDGGLMDKFPENTGQGTGCDQSQVMAYFDGNTVTALWNYAQAYSMSDNSYGTQFGPSSVGAINLVSGNTHGYTDGGTGDISGDVAGGSVIGDPQPAGDDCSSRETLSMNGQNVGDLLNAKGISWGWFEGGFKPTSVMNGKAVCGASHIGSDGKPKGDYIPHHAAFQYYASTANPHHLPPTSTALIGKQGDQANHNYDLSDFWNAFNAGNFPAVSFLKAPGYQDGHAGYSDPLAEQTFLVNTINNIMNSPFWDSTVIIISYDDSDGWYDHQVGPIVKQSNTSADALTNGACGVAKTASDQGRCGYGPRLPLLVISPWARQNKVDHSVSDQSSILRFIEDNFSLGYLGNGSLDSVAGSLLNNFNFAAPLRAPKLILDPTTGEPVPRPISR